MRRIPELVDCWFDSGAMPYAQWHWPFENEELATEQFPADYIAEAVDQTRGWFYTLLAIATLLEKGAPYKNVISIGHVLDEKGQKMSKSKGNVVVPSDAFDAVGVDAIRWYFYTMNAPGEPKLFTMKDVRERLTGFLGTLENCVKFWELYAERPEARNFSHGDEPVNLLDKWMFSRLHGLIGTTTAKLEAYDITGAGRGIEQFVVDDLSQWWLRRSRKRPEALGILRHVLLELDKLLAPFIPFTAEDMHERLHRGTSPQTLSVHLHDWPTAHERFVDTALEQQMGNVREYISAGLAVRKEQQIKVRQPLQSVTVPGDKLHPDLEQLMRDELNVKEVRYVPGKPVELDLNIGRELRAEGFARETMRAIQDMRKEANCRVSDKVRCQWSTYDADIADALTAHADMIARETNLSAFVRQADAQGMTVQKQFDLAPGKSLQLGILT
jgi:isoleucyl-tRNA synthetase